MAGGGSRGARRGGLGPTWATGKRATTGSPLGPAVAQHGKGVRQEPICKVRLRATMQAGQVVQKRSPFCAPTVRRS